MLKIALIKEGKKIPDTRVALTPEQCKQVKELFPNIEIKVQSSPNRSYSDAEYEAAGFKIYDDVSDCDIMIGIKEVRIEELVPNKTYFFFSHTKKKQPYNQDLMHALIAKKIRMIDYENITYDDGKRIIGFGYYAGYVGAHNGLLTYGKKTKQFSLIPAHKCKDQEEMLIQMNNLRLPPMKIVVTGWGKVATGILDVMVHWDIPSVEPQDFLENEYPYPVYTHLKGNSLYQNKTTHEYHRNEFYANPELYECIFKPYLAQADILMHGIYWEDKIDIMFKNEDLQAENHRLKVIADITCDPFGSIPINLGVSTIDDPVYGVNRFTLKQTTPFQTSNDTIDIMAVDNLPNELPRDASEHFGKYMIKYILPELLAPESQILDRATICKDGKLTPQNEYLADYAY